MIEKLIKNGYLERKDNKPYLSKKGKEAGGEWKPSNLVAIYGCRYNYNERVRFFANKLKWDTIEKRKNQL